MKKLFFLSFLSLFSLSVLSHPWAGGQKITKEEHEYSLPGTGKPFLIEHFYDEYKMQKKLDYKLNDWHKNQVHESLEHPFPGEDGRPGVLTERKKEDQVEYNAKRVKHGDHNRKLRGMIEELEGARTNLSKDNKCGELLDELNLDKKFRVKGSLHYNCRHDKEKRLVKEFSKCMELDKDTLLTEYRDASNEEEWIAAEKNYGIKRACLYHLSKDFSFVESGVTLKPCGEPEEIPASASNTDLFTICKRGFDRSKACCKDKGVSCAEMHNTEAEADLDWDGIKETSKDALKTVYGALPDFITFAQGIQGSRGEFQDVCSLGNVNALTSAYTAKVKSQCSKAEDTCNKMCINGAFEKLKRAYATCDKALNDCERDSVTCKFHKHAREIINRAYKNKIEPVLTSTYQRSGSRDVSRDEFYKSLDSIDLTDVARGICARANHFNELDGSELEEEATRQTGARYCGEQNPRGPNPFRKKRVQLPDPDTGLSIGSVIGNENGGDVIDTPLSADSGIDTEGLDDGEFDDLGSFAQSDFQEQPWSPGEDNGAAGAGSLGGLGSGGGSNGKDDAVAGSGYRKKSKSPNYSTGSRLARKGNGYRPRGKRVLIGSKKGIAVLSKKAKRDLSKYGRRSLSSVQNRSIFHKLSFRVREHCKSSKKNCF